MPSQKQQARKEFWLCGILLSLCVLAYHAFYFNSVLPVSDGWGIYYVELIKRGQMPYRDFYYYLPPLSLLIDYFFWSLSFGNILIFRGWYLLQRIFLVLLIYKLLTKWFSPRYVWIACLTGACLGTASLYDLVGDYNQTQSLLIIVLAYAMVMFLERDADSDEKGFVHYKYFFIAGIILSCMLLLKQSLGLAAIISCFVFLLVYCFVFVDKRFGWYCLSTATGAFIPITLCVLFLLANNAFFPFLEQFFGVADAKGGIKTILSAGITNTLIDWKCICIFFGFCLCMITLRNVLSNKTPETFFSFLASCIALIASTILGFRGTVYQAKAFLLSATTLSFAAVSVVIICILCEFFKKKKVFNIMTQKNNLLLTVLFFMSIFIAVFVDLNGVFSAFYYKTYLFWDITQLMNNLGIYAMLVGLVYGFVSYKMTKTASYPKPILALFLCGFLDFYACYMASGGATIPRMMFTIVPVFLVFVFSFELPNANWNSAKKLAVCVVCITLCGVCMTQKYAGAYSWWGTTEMYTLDKRTESVEVDALAGFKLSEQTKLEFEEVTRLIEENGNENSTVWGFPFVKIFNIITNHYNVDDPVPVLFYDVCSDDAAIQESEWLKNNYPDFVIWCDIPDCLEIHETIFRNGNPIGQRAIVNWFSEAKDSAYIKIGQVGNLFVYKLNDGSQINYTYFQDPEAKNISAGENAH